MGMRGKVPSPSCPYPSQEPCPIAMSACECSVSRSSQSKPAPATISAGYGSASEHHTPISCSPRASAALNTFAGRGHWPGAGRDAPGGGLFTVTGTPPRSNPTVRNRRGYGCAGHRTGSGVAGSSALDEPEESISACHHAGSAHRHRRGWHRWSGRRCPPMPHGLPATRFEQVVTLAVVEMQDTNKGASTDAGTGGHPCSHRA